MKKILSLAAALALVGGTGMAIEWGTLDNYAQGAVAAVSSNMGAKANVTDGNNGTGWQAVPSTHNVTSDWALIDLGQVRDFNTVEIMWEAAHPAKYNVYVSETEIPYEIKEANVNTPENPLMYECGFIDQTWLGAATPFAERTLEGRSNATDLIQQQGRGRYILVYSIEESDFSRMYGAHIFEVRVTNLENTDKVASLKVEEKAVVEGGETTVAVTAANLLGEPVGIDKVGALKLTCSDPAAVTIVPGVNGEFTVKGLKAGVYTLAATGTADGGAEVTGSASFTVMFDWATTPRIDLSGATVKARHIPGQDDPNTAANAIDGDETTYYEYNGQWGGGDSWVLVDLGADYMVEAIGVSYGDHSGGRFDIATATEMGEMEGHLQNVEYMWTGGFRPAGWNYSESTSRSSNAVATVNYGTPTRMRYITVRDLDNPEGKPQVREIYVKGEAYESPVATSLKVDAQPGGLFAGETANVVCTVLDQYGEPFSVADQPEITVTGADYADGVITATGKGKVEISAKLGELTASTAITVADVEDYCMGGATVTSDNPNANETFATDGGKAPGEHGGLYVITENESQGDHTHWILADLHKPHTLDMIIAIWEGACPADYDVYVGETEETLVKLYSVTGHTQNTWYDRFSGQPMENIQFIKIVTTKNATGYGIKLFDLKAYGTSAVSSKPETITLTADGNYISTGETINLKADVLDQFGARMEVEGIGYAVNSADAAVSPDGVFSATKDGTYTVTASYGELTSEPVTVNVVAMASTKFDKVESVTLAGATLEKNPLKGEEVQPGLGEDLVITFENPVDFTLLVLRWEAACPSHYTVTAEDKDGKTVEVLKVEERAFVAGVNPVDRVVGATPATGSMMLRANSVNGAPLSKVKKLTVNATAKDHGYNLRLFGIDAYGIEDTPTGSVAAMVDAAVAAPVDVYTPAGVLVRRNVDPARALDGLAPGLYLVGGEKVMKK